MSRDNVKRVLVTSGNQAPLAAGNGLDALALGQVGVFDASTNQSIDANSTPKNFYLAVGVDSDGDGAVDDVNFSAGQVIQANNLRSYSFRPHTPARPQILRIEGITPNAEVKEYAFKLEFRNQRLARRIGTIQFTHTFAVYNENFTQEEFVDEAVATVNANDQEGYVVARKVAVATEAVTVAGGASQEYVAGDDITVEGDIQVARDAGSVEFKIELESKPLAPNKELNVNIKYYDFRSTLMIASLVEGFDSNAKIVETQSIRFEEGDGNQIRQMEYHETGQSSPYVASSVNPIARQLVYNAVGSQKYDMIALEYDQFSVAGWLEHLNNLQTTVAIPMDETTTRDGLITVLDAQFSKQGFDSLADDAAGASTDPEVVEATEDETEATDGIG